MGKLANSLQLFSDLLAGINKVYKIIQEAIEIDREEAAALRI
jgi:hypothetical protein